MSKRRAKPMPKQAVVDSLNSSKSEEGDATLRIPVLAEGLVAETRLVARGTMHLHQGVTSEEQTLRVSVFHEEATIEHLPPEALANVATSDDPNVLLIPIYEEQVVVEKRLVLKEYIRVTKNRVTKEQMIRDTVRRTNVEIVAADGTVRSVREVNSAAQAANG